MDSVLYRDQNHYVNISWQPVYECSPTNEETDYVIMMPMLKPTHGTKILIKLHSRNKQSK